MTDSEPPVSESQLQCAACGYNLTGATIGSKCPECGAAIERSLRRYGQKYADPVASGAPGSLPTVGYAGPILVTIFCCLIGGIVSIVYTANANTAAAIGDTQAYEAAQTKRNGWILASVVIGVVAVLLQIVIAASS